MFKKSLIGLIILSVAFFIYTMYFRDNDFEYKENTEIKSLDVKYTNGIYTLRAKEQIDNTGDESITFKTVIVEYLKAKSYIKGDKAVKDKEDNVTLSGNVFGENKENGWTVKGQEIVYYKELDRFNSSKPVEAYNTKKKLKIGGNYFESDVNFNELLLEGKVVADTDNFNLLGEKAYYKNDILELIGDVKVELKSLNKKNKKDNSVVGVFPGATYDTKNRILKATGAYRLLYRDFIIDAKELTYDENTDIIVAGGGVVVSGETLTGNFPEATLNLKEDKIYFKGPINATYNELNFTGEQGIYDNVNETFEVLGKAIVTRETDILEAERAFYTSKTGIVEVFGKKQKFIYTGEGRELTGNYAKYDVNKNLIEVPDKFEFKYSASSGNGKEGANGSGNALVLDTTTQKGTAKNIIINQGKDNLKGNTGELDLMNKIYKLKGKVIGNYGNYVINTEEVVYDEQSGLVKIEKPYSINSKDKKIRIWGNQVDFDSVNYVVSTKDEVHFLNDKLSATGKEMIYNLNKKEGEFLKSFNGKVLKSGVQLTSNKAKYKEDEFVELTGNIKGFHQNYSVTTEKATYKIPEEKIYFSEDSFMSTTSKKMEGKTASGVYEVTSEKYTGHNFNGWSDKATVVSDYLNYDVKKEEAYLKDNITVKDKQTGAEVKGKEFRYYLLTDLVTSKEPLTIRRDNIFLEAKNGNADLKNKTAQLNKTTMTTSNKDRMTGDTLYANLLKNEFKFDGNIEGTVYSLTPDQLNGSEKVDYSSPIKFKGDLAKAFFIENGANKYIITRNEIINSSEFYYKDMKLQGDYIELDNNAQKIFAKGSSKISLESGNKIAAESIVMDMATEIANMKNNVVITNTSNSVTGINTKADKAVFNNKDNKVNLEGNIESTKGKTKLQADKGVYDLLTNKLNSQGNIYMSLDFDTAQDLKEKQKRDKELNDKILKAQVEATPPKVIDPSIEKIDLKNKINEVAITWKSSNDDYITEDGVVTHPLYNEDDVTISLTGTFLINEMFKVKTYQVVVKKDTLKNYIKSNMNKELLYIKDNRLLIKDTNNEIKVTFKSLDEKLIDKSGTFKVMDLSKLDGVQVQLIYELAGEKVPKTYKGRYINGSLSFVSLPF